MPWEVYREAVTQLLSERHIFLRTNVSLTAPLPDIFTRCGVRTPWVLGFPDTGLVEQLLKIGTVVGFTPWAFQLAQQ